MSKNKLIFPLVLTSITGCAIAPLSSCNQYKMSETTKAIVDEFIGNQEKEILGVTSIPRPSNFCYLIAEYLFSYIKLIQGEAQDIECFIDQYCNVCCTIDPSSGCDDWKPLIIQGHSDMVVAGMTEEEALQNGIDAVIDGSTIHSRGFKTSLGADNGIGTAMMLHLIKTRDQFRHGLIRFIFTADEEVGLIGAHYLKEEYLKDDDENFIPYLLNIDAEHKGEIYRSCTGNFLDKFYTSYQKESGQEALVYPIDIKLDGLAGGHSGLDIGKGRASADRILFELLNVIQQKGIKTQLVAYNHEKIVDGKVVDIKWQTNQLIQNGHIQFLCDKKLGDIKPIINECKNQWRQTYSGESINDWKFDIGSFTWTEDISFISQDNTAKLTQLIGSNNDPSNLEAQKNGMPYGVFQWKDEQHTTPKVSGNIGPIKICQGVDPNEIDFEIRDLVRTSVYGTEKDPHDWSVYSMETNYITAAEKAGVSYSHESGYQPWEYKEEIGNPLVEFLVDDYKNNLHCNPSITDSKGGVEPAEWVSKNPNIICSCIGAHIDNAHTSKETLHLDSIDICFQAILDTIAWMENAPDQKI